MALQAVCGQHLLIASQVTGYGIIRIHHFPTHAHLATLPPSLFFLTQLLPHFLSPRHYRSHTTLIEITFYLGYEATRHLKTIPHPVETPMGVRHEGVDLQHGGQCIIPILRAGLAMGDGMMELLPDAAVHHIGMYRSKGSLLPIQYYNRLPREDGEHCDTAFITDPCIATSNTLQAAVSIVKRWGAKKIVVVAAVGAKAGVDKLIAMHPDLEIYIGQVCMSCILYSVSYALLSYVRYTHPSRLSPLLFLP